MTYDPLLHPPLAPYYDICDGTNSLSRHFKSDFLLISVTAARPYVPGLSAPELLRLRSERMASSSTAPTTGLRR